MLSVSFQNTRIIRQCHCFPGDDGSANRASLRENNVQLLITVGTTMIADPEKLIAEKGLVLLRDLLTASRYFQALLFLQDKVLESV